jgi:hypothetical protein
MIARVHQEELMHRRPPAPEPEVPAELSIPHVPPLEIADYRALQQGQLIELKDGQQGVVLSVDAKADAEACALRYVRVVWPRDGALPLGQICELSATAAAYNGTFLLHGVWFGTSGKLTPERVVIEAIHRGLITARNCGVTWPLPATWQLSAQAAPDLLEIHSRKMLVQHIGCGDQLGRRVGALGGPGLADELARNHQGALPDAPASFACACRAA